MDILLLIVISGVGFVVAYNTYGRFVARKIFKLNPDAPVPSRRLNDGVDYVPTRKGIIFGHHFTSIAGTGPIVGPAIGIIWGWVPAVLWIFLGSIFMGAVHDLGALVVSLRNEGKSVSEIALKYINKRVRFIFFVVVFLALWIVIAIFGVIIAIVFATFPNSVLPVWVQIPIAVFLGYAVYKKGANVAVATAVAVAAMYLTIWLGSVLPFRLGGVFGMPATGVWTIILLIYAWVASTLPVTTLLQPRDYINAWQLFIMMGLLAAGAVLGSAGGQLSMVAPAINRAAAGAPSLWPFMFVTIACGAISGFHSLVASGTTPKQVSNEKDSLFVGYGSMLVEGALAVLVLVCVGAGIGMMYKTADGTVLASVEAWRQHYASWSTAAGLAAKLDAVVIGAANIVGTLGLSGVFGTTIMGVFIASFAGTTLDTSVRIQRYVIGELATDLKLPALANRWTATTLAVATAAILAFTAGPNGKGAMTLWPLFGTANQLLAALTLLVITMYLKRKGGLKFVVTAVPCLIMLLITCWAMILKERDFIESGKWLLAGIGAGIFVLAVWMLAETTIIFFKERPSSRPQRLEG